MKVITVCSVGICRSVGMADVLKNHFVGPGGHIDVIPLGIDKNDRKTFRMLGSGWADHAIVMHSPFLERVKKYTELPDERIHLCEVGPDVYGNRQNYPVLIDICWRWVRQHLKELELVETQ